MDISDGPSPQQRDMSRQVKRTKGNYHISEERSSSGVGYRYAAFFTLLWVSGCLLV